MTKEQPDQNMYISILKQNDMVEFVASHVILIIYVLLEAVKFSEASLQLLNMPTINNYQSWSEIK